MLCRFPVLVALSVALTISAAHAQRVRTPRRTPAVLGLWLGMPPDSSYLDAPVCRPARETIQPRAIYGDLVASTMFGLDHQHPDSALTLAAVDSVSMCFGFLPLLGARVALTVVDSLVVTALAFWPDSVEALPFDSVVSLVSSGRGPPLVRGADIAIWTTLNPVFIIVRDRWMLTPRASVVVFDAGACERFERRVHPPSVQVTRASLRAACWVWLPR